MKLYVTYGNGYAQRDNYSVVEGDDISECMQKIVAGTRNRYAFSYDEEGFKGQPEKYGLTEIPLQPQCREDGSHPWDAGEDD